MPELYPQENITDAEIAACRRVAEYMRRVAVPFLADFFEQRSECPENEAKRQSKTVPFVEFFIIFFPPIIEKFDNRMRYAIRQFAKNQIDANQLKTVTDEYIKAHTVVWLGGVPYWKVDEIG